MATRERPTYGPGDTVLWAIDQAEQLVRDLLDDEEMRRAAIPASRRGQARDVIDWLEDARRAVTGVRHRPRGRR